MQHFFSTIFGMGPSVLMPIIFFIIAIIIRISIGKAFKASLLIGIGFAGLGLVIQLLLTNLGPATNAMVNRFDVELTTIDTGWAVAASIGWGSSLMVGGVIMFILINFVMFILKLTKTVDIDVFNYYVFLVAGAVIYALTDSLYLSYIMMGVLFIVMLKIADWTAPKIQKAYGLEGISFPHLNCGAWVPFGIVTNWVVDRIPGLRDIEINPEKITSRFGVIGEPIVIGFILGAGIGILAGFNFEKILLLAINIAATMILLPKMVGILLEGLNIIKDDLQKKLLKKYPDREVYIGMDIALISTSPSILATGILLIPITLFLALILPGNKVLPLVDLPSLIFSLPMMGAFCRKDIFRMLISGMLMVTCILYAGTNLATGYTKAAQMSKVEIPKEISKTISLNSGVTNPIGWAGVKVAEVINSMKR